MRIVVETPVRATEDPERVEVAATAFFPGTVQRTQDRLTVHGHDLFRLRERIWELKIIDTVRAALLDGARPDGIRFWLSKQAAAAGKVSLPVSPHPLGDLRIDVWLDDADRWSDGEALAWWLCPETDDGKIVGPTD